MHVGDPDTLQEQNSDSLRLNLESVKTPAEHGGSGTGRSQGGDSSVRSWLNGERRNVSPGRTTRAYRFFCLPCKCLSALHG